MVTYVEDLIMVHAIVVSAYAKKNGLEKIVNAQLTLIYVSHLIVNRSVPVKENADAVRPLEFQTKIR